MGSKPRGISGSRAAAILGMSPWATPFSVWQDIMEELEPGFNAAHKYEYTPFEGNASTRWGLAFEDAIIKLAEERAGVRINEREKEFIGVQDDMLIGDDLMDYVTCHIDGTHVKSGFPLHEGKTTTAYGFGDKWGDPGTDKIPIEYQIQVQHQMLCTGADTAIVSVLVFPKRPDDWETEGIYPMSPISITKNKEKPSSGGIVIGDPRIWANTLAQMGYFHQYPVAANKELQSLMLEKYRVWWTKHVIGKKPPEPASYADIRAMITEPAGTIIVDDQIARMFKEFKDIGSEIGSSGNLAKRKNQLKTLILNHARELESTLDDESTDKWIFRDDRGKKLGSYGKNTAGNMVFR